MSAYNPHVSMVHAVIWLGLSNVVVNPDGLEHYVKLVGFIQYLDTSVSIRIPLTGICFPLSVNLIQRKNYHNTELQNYVSFIRLKRDTFLWFMQFFH